MKRIHFIRHAQSAANAGSPTDSPDTIPLTPQGIEQAETLGQQWQGRPDLIVTSTYLRTQQTAEPLRRRFPEIPVEKWPIHEFCYLSPERFKGTTEAGRRGEVERYWAEATADHVDGPGAESFASFAQRIEKALQDLAERPEQEIAVFCHGHVIKLIIWLTISGRTESLEETKRGFQHFTYDFPLDNAAVLPARVDQHGKWFLGEISSS